MIEYLLVVLVCGHFEAECRWQRHGSYASEERCVMNGLSIEPAVARFKCVMLERGTRAQHGSSVYQLTLPYPSFTPTCVRPWYKQTNTSVYFDWFHAVDGLATAPW